jgi:hypothetical protein
MLNKLLHFLKKLRHDLILYLDKEDIRRALEVLEKGDNALISHEELFTDLPDKLTNGEL